MPVPPLPLKNERVTLREAVTQQIRDAIFDGTLHPGEILHDAQLQEWLGVSRTPIREALNELARFGLIEMVPQKHTRVAQPRSEEHILVLQTLGALLGGVVRVTVPVLSGSQRTHILAACNHNLTLVEARDFEGHGRDGWALIDLFIAYCPNQVLVKATKDAVNGLAYQLRITRTEESANWDDLHAGYTALMDAVSDNDAITADLAIEQAFHLSTVPQSKRAA